jgi:hypothetical protein
MVCMAMFGLEPATKGRYIGGEFLPHILAAYTCRAIPRPVMAQGAGEPESSDNQDKETGALQMQLSNLTGKSVAIMVASGFDEETFIAIQRAMMSVNAKLRVISRDAGLTNAWNGSGWGMSYPVDGTLSTTLAVDYDALIVPTGERHVATLAGEAHAKRLLRAFTREDVPVLLLDDAASLLELVDIAAPAAADGADHAVAGGLVTGRADALMAGLEALNEAMIREDGESVAA